MGAILVDISGIVDKDLNPRFRKFEARALLPVDRIELCEDTCENRVEIHYTPDCCACDGQKIIFTTNTAYNTLLRCSTFAAHHTIFKVLKIGEFFQSMIFQNIVCLRKNWEVHILISHMVPHQIAN